MKRLIFLQFILAIVAISAGIASVGLGMQIARIETKGRMISSSGLNPQQGIEQVANGIDAGFDGGAIGMGIIAAACVLGIVWIEITKIKLKP